MAGAGHSLLVTGRVPGHGSAAVAMIGGGAESVEPADCAGRTDIVVLAIAWPGLVPALSLVGARDGRLAGATLMDCTHAVDYGTGRLLPERGSAAELVADTPRGAHVVKALHLLAGTGWPYVGPAERAPVVAVCGDDAGPLARSTSLIGDLGARAIVIGGLDAARQAEQAAGFAMRVVSAGANPRDAVPDVDPGTLRRA